MRADRAPGTPRATDVARLVAACRRLPLATTVLGPEYHYPALPLCVVDAVFSIGVRYETTRATVQRVADWFALPLAPADPTAWPPPPGRQLTLTAFRTALGARSAEQLAREIYGNRQRTSTHAGAPLKAAAVSEAVDALRRFDIETLQDFQATMDCPDVDTAFRAVPGQASGVSWRYLRMLAGDAHTLKPDRMILRFVGDAIGRPVTVPEATALVPAAHVRLARHHPHLTVRALDFAIWQAQRARRG